jgi:hypothetical protein
MYTIRTSSLSTRFLCLPSKQVGWLVGQEYGVYYLMGLSRILSKKTCTQVGKVTMIH